MRALLAVLLLLAANCSVAATDQLGEMAERGRQSPRGKACMSATKFFLRAQCEHRIPAYAQEKGSSFDADMGPYADLWTLTYPVSFTFRVQRPHDEHLYCYTVTKKSRFGSWSFQDGHKETKSGRRIATLPIPIEKKT